MSTISNPGASLVAQSACPPKVSLQLLGTHTTAEQTEVVDFDLWIDCSKQAKIKSGEFFTGNENDNLQDWLSDSNERTSWTINKIVSLSDNDLVAIKTHAEGLARSIAYGGSIIVEIHTPPLQADVAENTAEVRAEWSFGSPFISTEQPWDLLVMDAMVDRRRGFISVDEPRPSHGRSPFRRAMKSNNTSTVVSQVPNEEGFQYTVLQYSKWGSDI
ncbi:hypothetical protein PENPOL_c025G07157 [Penicillium polonicum]|uniref:Uncharacterized protein n=1 Tax=Penicillium polonicum TaxID=60169 RepID=A0A1V6N6N2_PENPO|nr:hypothetical protein PENPOL_c025G07157 [Penicillium polonicum]